MWRGEGEEVNVMVWEAFRGTSRTKRCTRNVCNTILNVTTCNTAPTTNYAQPKKTTQCNDLAIGDRLERIPIHGPLDRGRNQCPSPQQHTKEILLVAD